jgi:peptidoglycan hydrolase-like protein with peptidoglycan-binding domain
VQALEQRLADMHYDVGAVDGYFDADLRHGLTAFQKSQGLPRTGLYDLATRRRLAAPLPVRVRFPSAGRAVEVDLTKQVLYLVKNGTITRILPVSSGNGKKYRTKRGTLATALSPVGYYKIQRVIRGERVADLGTLYDPQYFYKGWAIHGSNSVPAYPASHGCTRVTRWDAKWLLKQIGVGTNVYVYGGKYTFTAGSSAPGTDDPGGDVEPAPTPSATPKPTPTPSPTASPTPSPKPSILPTTGP